MSFDRSNLPGPDVTDAMVVDDAGMPMAFINLPQLHDEAFKLAFTLAAADEDTFTDRFEEALQRLGVEAFGCTTTSALTTMVQCVVWPMVETIREATGIDFRAGLQAFADGTAPPPVEVHGVPVVMLPNDLTTWAFKTLFHTADRATIPQPTAGSLSDSEVEKTLAAYASVTNKTVDEVRQTSFIDCVAALAIAAIRTAAADLSIWAFHHNRHDLRAPMWPTDDPDDAA